MATTMNMSHSDATIKTTGGLDIIAGLWLIVAPFLLGYSSGGGSTTNDVVVGIAILILAALQLSGGSSSTKWPSWINTLLGLWLIVAPFIMNFPSGSAAMWNDIILGIVVGILSLTSALASPTEQ